MRTRTRGYAGYMGLFKRLFGSRSASIGAAQPPAKDAQAATTEHFAEFVSRNTGCEAFIEPATRVTQTTMVVVAETGEWTRRRVPDAQAGQKLAKKLGIPAFDVNLSGYPSRMREWNQRNRK